MRFEKLTLKAQEAFQNAQAIATNLKHQTIDVEHLLLAMLEVPEGLASSLLQKLSANPIEIADELREGLKRLPKVEGAASYGASMSSRLQNVMNDAFARAETMGDEFVSTDHLLLAIAAEGGTSGKLLRAGGVTEKDLGTAIEEVRGGRKVTDQGAEDKYQALEKYGIDLTARARAGKLDPVIGRDEEIRRAIQVLSRRTKNNPVLIGE
ncbi:type VI secretion system ATPase TssH, partial [bacterium]